MSDIRSKILDLDTLKEKSITIQNSGKKIVFTNGCFDVLHYGHLSYIEKNGIYVEPGNGDLHH